MPETVELKKYANRRLYDMGRSTYVTLDQVSEMVKEGKQIKVIDAKSQENVTAFVLTQILMEESKKNALLPVSLLHLIIRYGDNLLSEFFEKYLEETLRIFVNSKIAYDQCVREWLEMGMHFPGAGQDMRNMQMPFMQMMDMWKSASSQGNESEETTDTKSDSYTQKK